VFSSDAVASPAFASEGISQVLVPAVGAMAIGYLLPISIVMVQVLFMNQVFDTTPLDARSWMMCIGLARASSAGQAKPSGSWADGWRRPGRRRVRDLIGEALEPLSPSGLPTIGAWSVELVERRRAPRQGEIMSPMHAIVWLDHREARIITFSLGTTREVEVHSRRAEQRVHHKAGSIGSGHAADDHEFFDEIVAALVRVHEVLIAGPGNAKIAFRTYVTEHDEELERRVVGVETMDHPTDPELLAAARRSFLAIDRLGLGE
jgi:hypothetical protein